MALTSLYSEPERPQEAAEAPALDCRDVFKIHRSGPVETVALRGLDLRVERGELVAVLGPSGCGKSTLLSLAAGLDEPSAGEVRAFGASLGLMGERALARHRAATIALVFQSENLWPALSARANVALSLALAGPGEHDEPEAALAAFGLRDRARVRAGLLSGGEQQRVAIAAAAARRAPLVLADEPTGELDEASEREVLAAFERLRTETGSAIVVVTHSPRVAEAADRVVELRDGRLA
ncbi:MAG: putative transport system ATP-binding protein [Solirubrobacteraceae bacterium]|nr:putative transport system ATP-binding protein [Solirubrobacteraceae bacterium]